MLCQNTKKKFFWFFSVLLPVKYNNKQLSGTWRPDTNFLMLNAIIKKFKRLLKKVIFMLTLNVCAMFSFHFNPFLIFIIPSSNLEEKFQIISIFLENVFSTKWHSYNYFPFFSQIVAIHFCSGDYITDAFEKYNNNLKL